MCASGEMRFKQQKASTKPKGLGLCLVHQFSEDESVKERLDGKHPVRSWLPEHNGTRSCVHAT